MCTIKGNTTGREYGISDVQKLKIRIEKFGFEAHQLNLKFSGRPEGSEGKDLEQNFHVGIEKAFRINSCCPRRRRLDRDVIIVKCVSLRIRDSIMFRNRNKQELRLDRNVIKALKPKINFWKVAPRNKMSSFTGPLMFAVCTYLLHIPKHTTVCTFLQQQKPFPLRHDIFDTMWVC